LQWLFPVGAWVLVAGCAEPPPCPDDTPTVVPIPSGMFAPADTYPLRTVFGTPFFSGTLLRGAVDREGAVDDPGSSYGDIDFGFPPGPVPSAQIEVDRVLRTVTPSPPTG
jgi:hypothetical protein